MKIKQKGHERLFLFVSLLLAAGLPFCSEPLRTVQFYATALKQNYCKELGKAEREKKRGKEASERQRPLERAEGAAEEKSSAREKKTEREDCGLKQTDAQADMQLDDVLQHSRHNRRPLGHEWKLISSAK